MDALELSLKCSSLLIRSMSSRSGNVLGSEGQCVGGLTQSAGPSTGAELHWNESDFEKHFKDHGTAIKYIVLLLQDLMQIL